MRALLPSLLGCLAILPDSLQAQTTAPARHESLKQEIELAFERGLNFLRARQDSSTGQWGTEEPVAFTGMMTANFLLDPNREADEAAPLEAIKGIQFLLKNGSTDLGRALTLCHTPGPQLSGDVLQEKRLRHGAGQCKPIGQDAP